jgi:hypothetical protein
MPGGDGTGPLGHGPMTGGGFGFCAGFSNPVNANPGIGRGLGRGRGRGLRRVSWGRGGRGFFGRGFYQDPYYHSVQSREEEKVYLENMVKGLEEEISSIRERIKILSKEKKENP